STDYIGMSYDYPEASYERREQIIREHEDYQKGLMYFLANDPRVPTEVQEEVNRWGLAKDEFTDNGHWPHQLYIREARRMIGQKVMTEHEVLGNREVVEPVGMGSYTLDSHNVQRYITPEGHVQNEGDIGVHPDQPYQIAYGSLIPKEGQAENLLVPVALSASHIAFGSIRMEPVFMILGHSAAAAAALALEEDVAVQNLNYQLLREQLLGDGQILEYE
ncbi:FAD-dependent oxidoreductase, partial [Fodinibius sp.]|uniref:FAD-dependent oxidoreductase n=1 Tax=Fodinibius sp. TaxID=1872440 RepID=UPI003566A8E0